MAEPRRDGYRAGEAVWVFYRIDHNGSDDLGGGYFPLRRRSDCLLTPRYGVTDGWRQAVVAEDWDPPGDDVSQDAWPRIVARPRGGIWATRRGDRVDLTGTRSDHYSYFRMRFGPDDVRRGLPPKPSASFISVRWGPFGGRCDGAGGAGGERRGPELVEASDKRIAFFFDNVHRQMGPTYEVLSCFVTREQDFAVIPQLSALLRADTDNRLAVWWVQPATNPTSPDPGTADLAWSRGGSCALCLVHSECRKRRGGSPWPV
eukprot:TRINITY_DN16599_c0_g1_i1.p1 TRINITY_DN16599_c0_g1~~TRINITY_DN16599_c0_g1_i1.p1  ORF type:complete len:281 (+),score=62.13 TRINITY_DN16599_c0_g1_i1:66-845(+)